MFNYKENDIVKCMVTAIESYGFFVNTELGFSGLVHISEIATGYVKDIKSYVGVGDVIYAKIIESNKKDNQLSLSIKNINYKSPKKTKNINEDSGFFPLAQKLDSWISEKIDEYK